MPWIDFLVAGLILKIPSEIQISRLFKDSQIFQDNKKIFPQHRFEYCLFCFYSMYSDINSPTLRENLLPPSTVSNIREVIKQEEENSVYIIDSEYTAVLYYET
jgi:hypothetical protein